ncbi:MAG: phosphate ABC transporter substrate-binding protein [SAR324 cluster bacterium]|nr:phosphate ABC transporter substrate-binding protein [SAR324 cluster bacterium]
MHKRSMFGIFHNFCLAIALAIAAAGFGPGVRAQTIEVDPSLPAYEKVGGASGNLNSIGSDTLNNLMTLWSEGFRKLYPNVNFQVEGKGSSTAPPALIQGTAQLGPMSRRMKRKEIDDFERIYGFKPTLIGVALDSLVVYVNKDNPVTALSLQQVDAIFSQTRKGGLPGDIVTWDQLGVTSGPLAGRPISLYGRNSASGTYGYFKKHALFKGDYKDRVKEQPGSASVVMGVTEDLRGIGYSGIGYRTSGVKAIALSRKDGDPAYEPTYENVLNGKYPLSRMLYIYVVKKPNEPLPPLVGEFIKYVLSREGQQVVVKDGYLPLPAKISERQVARLN